MFKTSPTDDGVQWMPMQQHSREEVKPKKPPSAYNLFFKEHHKKILTSQKLLERQARNRNDAKQSSNHFVTATRAVSKLWNGASIETKQVYENLAAIEGEKYRKDLAEWESTHWKVLSKKSYLSPIVDDIQLPPVAETKNKTSKRKRRVVKTKLGDTKVKGLQLDPQSLRDLRESLKEQIPVAKISLADNLGFTITLDNMPIDFGTMCEEQRSLSDSNLLLTSIMKQTPMSEVAMLQRVAALGPCASEWGNIELRSIVPHPMPHKRSYSDPVVGTAKPSSPFTTTDRRQAKMANTEFAVSAYGPVPNKAFLDEQIGQLLHYLDGKVNTVSEEGIHPASTSYHNIAISDIASMRQNSPVISRHDFGEHSEMGGHRAGVFTPVFFETSNYVAPVIPEQQQPERQQVFRNISEAAAETLANRSDIDRRLADEIGSDGVDFLIDFFKN